MTAVAERVAAPGAPREPSLRVRFGWAVTDTCAFCRLVVRDWPARIVGITVEN